jgi:alpha-tubulin suppressor-like RCC1 family protein
MPWAFSNSLGLCSAGVVTVSAGWYHTCALLTSGGVKCWGSNAEGQLGTGNGVDFKTPTSVLALGTGQRV